MTTLDKLQIGGIRSYNPKKPQVIQFYKHGAGGPLTLVVGQNGAGKTVRCGGACSLLWPAFVGWDWLTLSFFRVCCSRFVCTDDYRVPQVRVHWRAAAQCRQGEELRARPQGKGRGAEAQALYAVLTSSSSSCSLTLLVASRTPPQVSGETDTKGQVKLKFVTQEGNEVLVQRSVQLIQKAKKQEFKSLDMTCKIIDAQTNEVSLALALALAPVYAPARLNPLRALPHHCVSTPLFLTTALSNKQN